MERGLKDGDTEFLRCIEKDLSRAWPGYRPLPVRVGNGCPCQYQGEEEDSDAHRFTLNEVGTLYFYDIQVKGLPRRRIIINNTITLSSIQLLSSTPRFFNFQKTLKKREGLVELLRIGRKVSAGC